MRFSAQNTLWPVFESRQSHMQYRLIKRGDVKQVQSVALAVWKYTYRNIYSPKRIEKYVSSYYSDKSFGRLFSALKKGNESFFVAVKSRKIVGYAHAGKEKKGWELRRIYLLPKYIGKGIGRGLLARIERWLRRKGAGRYFVLVHSKNSIGINFYVSSGFARVKRKDESSTSWYFEKRL